MMERPRQSISGFGRLKPARCLLTPRWAVSARYAWLLLSWQYYAEVTDLGYNGRIRLCLTGVSRATERLL